MRVLICGSFFLKAREYEKVRPQDATPAGYSEVVRFIEEEISKNTYVNIMDQYYPCYQAFDHPPLDRRIMKQEFKEAIKFALEAGLTRLDGLTV